MIALLLVTVSPDIAWTWKNSSSGSMTPGTGARHANTVGEELSACVRSEITSKAVRSCSWAAIHGMLNPSERPRIESRPLPNRNVPRHRSSRRQAMETRALYEGVELKIPHKNEANCGMVVQGNFRAGKSIPPHTRPLANERDWILAGEWEGSDATYMPGIVLCARKRVQHAPHVAKSELVSHTIFDGPLTAA